MKIEITKDDIANGLQYRGIDPLSLGVRRALDASIVQCYSGYVEVIDFKRDTFSRYRIPSIATNFFLQFDNCIPVQPITFELDLDDRI